MLTSLRVGGRNDRSATMMSTDWLLAYLLIASLFEVQGLKCKAKL